MREAAKRWVRTVQTRFPGLVDMKFAAQRRWRRALRRPFDADFRVLAHLPVEPGEQFLDVGANRGQSIDAIRLHHPRAAIVAFEANLILAERLERLFRSDPAVEIRAYGLAEADGEATLHIPFYRDWMFDGLASVDRDSARDWLGPRTIAGFREDLLRIEERRCTLHRLDDLGLTPAFVKIDVQGFEESVLLGGRETLARCEPVLLVEQEGDERFAILRDLGYREYAYAGGALRPMGTRTKNSFHLTDAGRERLRRGGLRVDD